MNTRQQIATALSLVTIVAAALVPFAPQANSQLPTLHVKQMDANRLSRSPVASDLPTPKSRI